MERWLDSMFNMIQFLNYVWNFSVAFVSAGRNFAMNWSEKGSRFGLVMWAQLEGCAWPTFPCPKISDTASLLSANPEFRSRDSQAFSVKTAIRPPPAALQNGSLFSRSEKVLANEVSKMISTRILSRCRFSGQERDLRSLNSETNFLRAATVIHPQRELIFECVCRSFV